MKSDNRNLVLTILISTFILIGWQYFYERPRMEAMRAFKQVQQEVRMKEDVEKKDELLVRDAALKTSPRVGFENQDIKGSISLTGLRIDDLLLKKYNTELGSSDQVILFAPANSYGAYFAEIGWLSSNPDIKLPGSKTEWKADKTELKPGEEVKFTYNNGQGLLFQVSLKLDDNYMFDIKQEVTNTSNNPVTLFPYGLISKMHETDHKTFAILHEGPIGVLGSELKEVTYDELKSENKKVFKDNVNGWVGQTDKYWFSAFIPSEGEKFTSTFSFLGDKGENRFQTDYMGEKFSVSPGDKSSYESKLFAGAKELAVLDGYAAKYNIKLFDRAVDFGWFYFLTKPMFLILKIFDNWLGNFGLAILLVTIFVKAVLYPLADKSYRSMNGLKRLQPKIEHIKKQHTERQKLNQAMMDLYKTEKVNPLAGCLPLLIQIPVFFSLYKVLFVTIEMRHAPFYGWIQDLSAADPTNIFTLFGLLSWNPPALLQIGIWPIIMAVTMYFQQMLNPQPQDPAQAKVMKFLPLIFVFMFASFPAGLIIYWAWNNILSIAQQGFLMLTHREEKVTKIER